MPIYEYECTACGHQLEVLQKVSDSPLRECPACGEPALKKLLSLSAFRLKGTGWYETDFKDSGKPKKSDKKGDGGADGGAKSSKTEDKPAGCCGGGCGC